MKKERKRMRLAHIQKIKSVSSKKFEKKFTYLQEMAQTEKLIIFVSGLSGSSGITNPGGHCGA
jgi:hypothetical protein